MSDLATATHQITWTHGVATFHCDGDQASECHNYPACDCESWEMDTPDDEPTHHRHPEVPQAECWITPWLNNTPVEDTYSELTLHVPQHDGLIEWEWEGEGVLWTYAAEARS